MAAPTSGAELWERLASVAPMMVRALLADMRLVSLDGSDALLACAPFARGTAEKKLGDLSKLMSQVAGHQITARLSDEAVGSTASDGPSEGPAEPAGAPPDADHPLVRQALDIFDGRIIDIKPVRSKPNEEI